MISEDLWTLLPDDLPPNFPSWVEWFGGQSNFSQREFRSYAWAMFLIEASNPFRFIDQEGRRAYADVSAGFIPFDLRDERGPRARLRDVSRSVRIKDMGYTFGLVVGVDPAIWERFASPNVPTTITGDPRVQGFPLVIEPREVQVSSPPDPVGARASCYVAPQMNKRFYGPKWSAGIVMARHSLANLGFNLGTIVNMTDGGNYPVCDVDADTTIDAAIVDCGSLPPGAIPLPITTAVAPGSTVRLHLNSGATNASVLRVHDHPHYFGNAIAHRIFTDTHGKVGDSGCIVTDVNTHHAAGTYIGNTNAPYEGLVQSFRQISKYFEVDLFM